MRRTIPAILASAALVLALSVAAPALAQDQATSVQPPVGAWLIHPFGDDPTQVGIMVFDAGGTLVTTEQDGTTGLGAWTSTGDRAFDLTFDQAIRGDDGSFVGISTIRASGEVAEDGQTFSGTWTFEPPEALAGLIGVPAGQLGPGEVTGERITAQPAGEPVAPMPDLTQSAPPSPEASPAA